MPYELRDQVLAHRARHAAGHRADLLPVDHAARVAHDACHQAAGGVAQVVVDGYGARVAKEQSVDRGGSSSSVQARDKDDGDNGDDGSGHRTSLGLK
ncbi:hypothetical protein GCM10022248_45800 [Nonomuraea soli]